MALAQFRIYKPEEFTNYLFNNLFTRKIKVIQNHHTWQPGYTYLSAARGEMFWLESMRNAHIRERKWSDIGQNITTFPSGNIALCRPIEMLPAGIRGANSGAICIEHFGNFDQGKNEMTDAHTESIVLLNALLCKKFGLSPAKSQVVYHHWFDRHGIRFSDEKINGNHVGDEQKTCPGTAFFGGNSIVAAEQNFYPLITAAMQRLPGTAGEKPKTARVVANILNVRNGPGITYRILRKLPINTEVTIYAGESEWRKISNTTEEWVFSQLLSE